MSQGIWVQLVAKHIRTSWNPHYINKAMVYEAHVTVAMYVVTILAVLVRLGGCILACNASWPTRMNFVGLPRRYSWKTLPIRHADTLALTLLLLELLELSIGQKEYSIIKNLSPVRV